MVQVSSKNELPTVPPWAINWDKTSIQWPILDGPRSTTSWHQLAQARQQSATQQNLVRAMFQQGPLNDIGVIHMVGLLVLQYFTIGRARIYYSTGDDNHSLARISWLR